ncbi:MAG: hypothetical protein RMK64_02295 [Rhodovarius sp.]|nr:hypothetical protein [Rhodovarius sp.]MCX7932831.1 hypothetical protein [Rhodovarius sp.]MDW8313777.1 hypothetical protein [Rhodovarius sp.]
MSSLSITFAPAALALFLAVLALVPLAMMWLDAKRRAGERARLSRLQEQARLSQTLRQQSPAPRTPLHIPGE